MRNTLLLYLFFNVVNFSSQVNLIPNPSFDVYTTCPTSDTDMSMASPWFMPSGGTSDFFHACAQFNSGVNIPGPNFLNALSYAHTGNGMMGLVHSVNLFSNCTSCYREYIGVRLKNILVSNKTYYVSFFVKLMESSRYAGSLGMLIFKDSIFNPGLDVINVMPQVKSPVGSFIKDKTKWTIIAGSFISNGSEQFVYIGNFKQTSINDTVFVGPPPRNPALDGPNQVYYYIDDVCVSEDPHYCLMWTGSQELSRARQFKISPNPSNSEVKIVTSYFENIMEIELTNLQGKLIRSVSEIDAPEYEFDISTLDPGMYFINVKSGNNSSFEWIIKN